MQAGPSTGSAEVWLGVTILPGGGGGAGAVRVTSQAHGRWPVVWSGGPGALVDPLAAARRSLNCFQVVFQASFCSCWALPIPSREAKLREEAQGLFPGPWEGGMEPEAWSPWSLRHQAPG